MIQGDGDCDQILFDSDLKQACLDQNYYQNALSSNDSSLCLKIEQEALREDCLARVYYELARQTGNYDMCDQVRGPLQQSCLDQKNYSAAIENQQLTLCESIIEPTLKQTCFDEVQFVLAVESGELSSCNNVVNATLLARCRERIQSRQVYQDLARSDALTPQVNYSDPKSGCAALSGTRQSECEDKAQFLLATQKLDLTFCQNIKNATMKSECTNTVTLQANSTWLRRALSESNADFCNRILSADLVSLCHTQVQ
ncbi:hypothetical protein IPJ72_03255 [Candidatus Peregrinibacteria bacterium]|nr:MAG: hypothetical protein IPJ72_03255 [Candidatus Peregrinibacteria bacterium]